MMLAICSASAAGGAPRQVIIDTDPGTDDAIAIMLALNSPEVAVRALTVVAGIDRYVATGAERVTPNADVATMVDAERFVQLLLSRVEGK